MSCCGGSSKSEPTKVATAAATQPVEAAAEQAAGNSNKSECCKDAPAKGEKHGCGC